MQEDVHQIILENRTIEQRSFAKVPLIVSGKLEVQVHAQPKSPDKVKELRAPISKRKQCFHE